MFIIYILTQWFGLPLTRVCVQPTGQHAGGVPAGAAGGGGAAEGRRSGSAPDVSGAGPAVRRVTVQPADGSGAVPARQGPDL